MQPVGVYAANMLGLSEQVPAKVADWEPESAKINAPILTAQARNPHLTQAPAFAFKPWKFCPWCGEGDQSTGIRQWMFRASNLCRERHPELTRFPCDLCKGDTPHKAP